MRATFCFLLVPLLAGCIGIPGASNDGSGGDDGSPTGGPPGQGGQPDATTPGDGTLGNATTPAGPPRNWTAPGAASIRPGVSLVSGGAQCTSNFIFTSPDNESVYIGFAAHCVAEGAVTDTNGCASAVKPAALNSSVEVEGASKRAKLVYTSWGTMQAVKESGESACRYNDFAIAQIAEEDEAKVNPSMLYFGGPTSVADPGSVANMDKVLTYGNSGLRAGIAALSPHEGYVTSAPSGSDWTTSIQTIPPGVSGDSGSGVLMGDGRALGILVTIGSNGNGVTSLENALEYAREEAGLDFRLATWTAGNGGLLPPL